MDKSGIKQEVDAILINLENNLDSLDESSKEYSQAVNNASKLQQMIINEEDLELKKSRNAFDESIRKKQITIEKDKLAFERDKFNYECNSKELDRELERERLNNQHIERMAEIEVNRIKAENEKTILIQNQIKAEKEFKANRRRDWLIFGGKTLSLFLIVGINVLMHRDELIFERDDNGIVPSRCKTYDAVVNKAAETVLK